MQDDNPTEININNDSEDVLKPNFGPKKTEFHDKNPKTPSWKNNWRLETIEALPCESDDIVL